MKHDLAKFGVHWSTTSGDLTYLQVREGLCDNMRSAHQNKSASCQLLWT